MYSLLVGVDERGPVPARPHVPGLVRRGVVQWVNQVSPIAREEVEGAWRCQ